MRWWIVAMVVAGVSAAGCGRESSHGDPPPGGWQNGATNTQSFFGPATTQFMFSKDTGAVSPDAQTTDLAGAEDVGGPIILDL